MIALVLGAAVAGLVGSPHCIGMCGPFAAACGGSVRRFSAWHAGRIATYAILGAIAGAAGSAVFLGPSWLGTGLSIVLIVGFSLVLAGLLPEPRVESPRLQRWATSALRDDSVWGRFGLGLANGLLPCGLVYAALGLAVAAGSALGGATVMLALGLGTTPALAFVGIGIRKRVGQSLATRRTMALLVLVAGLASVWMRTQGVHMHHEATTEASAPTAAQGAPDAGHNH